MMLPQTLGLYIHWPYCESKCPYCDFNSFVGRTVDLTLMENAYVQEMHRFFERTKNHTLRSIFFGGGTPSLMPPLLTKKLIDTAKTLWKCATEMEITLEANPSTAEAGRFEAFFNGGVNRLSLGVQSFRAESLKFLGRNHGAEEAKGAIILAQKIFPRVSFDLIYALPHQTISSWKEELEEALAFKTTHLSLYQLTIEPGTAFAPRYKRGEFYLPEENLAADMFELTNEVCAAHDLPSYEISNYAKIGQESQHNLIYWRYEDYVGIGPGAHGRITEGAEKIATEQHKAPDVWLKKIQEEGHGDVRTHLLSKEDQGREAVMMGLRLRQGITLHEKNRGDVLNHKALDALIKEGLLEYSLNAEGVDDLANSKGLKSDLSREKKSLRNKILRTTPTGALCLNGIVRSLLQT